MRLRLGADLVLFAHFLFAAFAVFGSLMSLRDAAPAGADLCDGSGIVPAMIRGPPDAGFRKRRSAHADT